MKKVVIFALIAAICAGALLYLYLGNLEQQKQVEVVYEEVVIAATDIPAYTPITSGMVTMKRMPVGSAHPSAARSMDQVIGYVTENDILAGEEILPAKLKQLGQTESGMSYTIPVGMRAITVAVDGISGIAGFIQRGDYVDVLAYLSVQVLSYNGMSLEAYKELTGMDAPAEAVTVALENGTMVVAQNICVAAIGSTFANSSKDIEGGYGSVTLYVTPEDAMRITQAVRSGALTLVLRASGDHEKNTEDPLLIDRLMEKAK